MPVPNSIDDLEPVPADNYPAGSEPVFPHLDNYLRAHAAFIAQVHALLKEGLELRVEKTSDSGVALLPEGNDEQRPDTGSVPAGALLMRGNTQDPASYRLEFYDRNLGLWASIGPPQVSKVPAEFIGGEITVTQPHLRKMTWSTAQGKYVRAPWHQPCQLFFSYDNPSSIPGALPVRGDVTWQQADFPDVVERLGLSGSGTFTLVEARGEGVRILDNGRGVDVDRGLRSVQLDAMQGHWHQSYTGAASSLASMIQGDQLPRDAPVGIKKTVVNNFANEPISDGVNGAPRVSIETRMRNIAFPLWMTI